jgi:hypothetical protein
MESLIEFARYPLIFLLVSLAGWLLWLRLHPAPRVGVTQAVPDGRRLFMGITHEIRDGTGFTYLVTVIDATSRQAFKVENTYRGTAGTASQMINELIAQIKIYKPIRVLIESNGLGAVFVERIQDGAWKADRNIAVSGFHVTYATKREINDHFQRAIENGHLSDPDHKLHLIVGDNMRLDVEMSSALAYRAAHGSTYRAPSISHFL